MISNVKISVNPQHSTLDLRRLFIVKHRLSEHRLVNSAGKVLREFHTFIIQGRTVHV